MDDLIHPGVAACLREVRASADAGHASHGFGICSAVWAYAHDTGTVSPFYADEWLKKAFSRLELDPAYPVPDPNCECAGLAYDMADNLWDTGTAYGRNRRRLLDALIAIAEGRSYELRFE